MVPRVGDRYTIGQNPNGAWIRRARTIHHISSERVYYIIDGDSFTLNMTHTGFTRACETNTWRPILPHPLALPEGL